MDVAWDCISSLLVAQVQEARYERKLGPEANVIFLSSAVTLIRSNDFGCHTVP